jgi:hypothetical protein
MVGAACRKPGLLKPEKQQAGLREVVEKPVSLFWSPPTLMWAEE